MKRKWLFSMITSMLAVTLFTGCGMNNNDPVDELPTDQNVDDRDVENETNREVDDGNLQDDNNLDEEFNNDRTNENNQGNQ